MRERLSRSKGPRDRIISPEGFGAPRLLSPSTTFDGEDRCSLLLRYRNPEFAIRAAIGPTPGGRDASLPDLRRPVLRALRLRLRVPHDPARRTGARPGAEHRATGLLGA